MTLPSRAGLVDDVTARARTAWRRWHPFYGDLDGAIIGRAKAPHEVLGLIAVVVSAALTANNPQWALDLGLDAKNGPVCVWVRDGKTVHHVPIVVEERKVRIASPGYGEGENVPIALAGEKAGGRFLDALAVTAATLLVPIDLDRQGRGRDV